MEEILNTAQDAQLWPQGALQTTFSLNGLWTGIEVKAGETTVIDPAYLKIETPGKDNLYLLDAETRACRQLSRVWRATPHRKSCAAVVAVVSRGIPESLFL